MQNEEKSKTPFSSCLITLFLFTIGVSIFAWITYGSLDGVLGSLAYIVVGLMNIFPWIIPFAGIPLGILDFFKVFGIGMYDYALMIARLQGSWISITWYWIISILASSVDIVISIVLIIQVKRLFLKKKEPKKNIALINCNIIDGNRNSPVIKNGVILIKNVVKEDEIAGRITEVGKKEDISIPPNFKSIDLKGKFVLPGLINAHCHLFGTGKPSRLMQLSESTLKRITKLLNNRLVKLWVKRKFERNAQTALNAGVTTIRSMSDFFYFDVKLRKKIEENKVHGPRIICAGKGIYPTGGHGMLGFEVDSKAEIRKAVRRNIREEVDCIKILSTGGVMDARMIGEAGRPQMTVEEIEIACIEAHRGNLLIATHCESTKGMKEALLGGVDTIEHGAEITDEMVELFKNNPKSLRGYTAVVPTITAGMGMATLPYEDTKITKVKYENAKLIEIGMIKALQRAYKEGIRFGVGTDASVPYSTHYNVWKELKHLVKYTRMSNQEAIYYATKNNAEILGIENETGSIEVNKSADLQIIRGNPLENLDLLGEVQHVIIKGYFIKNPRFKPIKKLKEITPIEV